MSENEDKKPEEANFSLRNKESKQAYHEDKARKEFGDDFVEQLKNKQKEFRGDWWQLAMLVKNLEEDEKREGIKPEERLANWNDWRERNEPTKGGEYPHLECANLTWAHLERVHFYEAHLEHAHLGGAHLENAWLGGAHMENADLHAAHLEHANLNNAHLESTNLMGANMGNAWLERAHLENANLSGSHLKNAILQEARMKNANLTGAHLENAWLGGAHMENAKLRAANLENAKLRETHLENTRLGDAIFDRTDVRGAKGILFDETSVDRIRIEGKAPDAWSVLRRQYTGPWFFVHLLLLILFFTPYIAKVGYLTAESHLQKWAEDKTQVLIDRIPDVPKDAIKGCEEAWKLSHREIGAWKVLVGLDGRWWPFIMTLIIIFYNVLRGGLTLQVSALRDAEERSKVTPKLEEYYGKYHPIAVQDKPWYNKLRLIIYEVSKSLVCLLPPFNSSKSMDLFRIHRVARILMCFAIVSVVYNVVYWIWVTKVWVAGAN